MRIDKRHVTNWALFISISIGIVLPAFAQPVPTTGPVTAAAATSSSAANSNSMTAAAENQPGTVSGFLQVSRTSSLYDFQDGTRKNSMDYELKTLFQISNNYALDIDGSYSQDLHDSAVSDFDDTVLTINRKAIDLGRFIQMAESALVVTPTSKDSHIRQNLLLGARGALGFGLNPVINPNLSMGLSFSGGQNFHAFDTSLDGKALVKYSFSQGLSIGYSFGRISLSGVLKHIDSWSYQGQLTEAYKHVEEVGVEINKRFAIAAGHTNGGSMFKANAQDSNLELINDNSSIVYGSLTYVF